MRKIINSTYVTLDGVIERPQDWPSLASRGGAGDDVQVLLFRKSASRLFELVDAKTLDNGIAILSYSCR
jgi:hypothetical protein